MREFLEIIVAFLAVFGAWSLIRKLKESILFPKKVRMRVAAAIHDGADQERPRARICKLSSRGAENRAGVVDYSGKR